MESRNQRIAWNWAWLVWVWISRQFEYRFTEVSKEQPSSDFSRHEFWPGNFRPSRVKRYRGGRSNGENASKHIFGWFVINGRVYLLFLLHFCAGRVAGKLWILAGTADVLNTALVVIKISRILERFAFNENIQPSFFLAGSTCTIGIPLLPNFLVSVPESNVQYGF